jgi:hypothetical protein
MRDILSYAMAAMIALLAQIATPWSDLWWGGMIVAGVVALFATVHLLGLPPVNGLRRLLPMWPQFLMVIGFITFMVGLAAFVQRTAIPRDTPIESPPSPAVSVVPAPVATPSPATGTLNKVEKNDQRIFVPDSVTPYSLMALYDDNLDIKADRLFADFVGKWMRLSGPVRNMSVSSSGRIYVSLAPDPKKSLKVIIMFFESEWLDRLAIIPRGQVISVECQITEAASTEIRFENCRLI